MPAKECQQVTGSSNISATRNYSCSLLDVVECFMFWVQSDLTNWCGTVACTVLTNPLEVILVGCSMHLGSLTTQWWDMIFQGLIHCRISKIGLVDSHRCDYQSTPLHPACPAPFADDFGEPLKLWGDHTITLVLYRGNVLGHVLELNALWLTVILHVFFASELGIQLIYFIFSWWKTLNTFKHPLLLPKSFWSFWPAFCNSPVRAMLNSNSASDEWSERIQKKHCLSLGSSCFWTRNIKIPQDIQVLLRTI